MRSPNTNEPSRRDKGAGSWLFVTEYDMEVEVRLFAVFREGRFKSKRMDVPAGASVGDVLGSLTIPQEQVGILLVNGQGGAGDRKLNPDDVIAVFPLVGGG